jgi:hypoxanthine phosphoribosyltransferase
MMPIGAAEAWFALEHADQLYSAEEVAAALDRLAMEITAGFEDRDPLMLVVMHGGLIPAAELFVRLSFPFQIGYVHATRYAGGTRGGDLHWIARPSRSVVGRVVLVIDDILDEGTTLGAIVEELRKSGAAEICTAVLVNKIHDRKQPGLEADFVGLDVMDRYVFGCGMDYNEYFRNLPSIYALKDAP